MSSVRPFEPGWPYSPMSMPAVAALGQEDRELAILRPAVDRVVVGIAEEKIAVGLFGARYPDWPFGEQESASKLLDLRVRRNDLVERGIFPDDLRRRLADRNLGRLVEIERCRLDPDEVLGAVGDRAVDAEDRELNPLAGLCVPGDDHAVRRVESLDHRPARLAQDAGHLAVHPHLGVVVDDDLESDGRTCGAEVADLFGDRDVDAVPVEADFGGRTALVERRGVDGLPLRIVEVGDAGVGSVVVGLDWWRRSASSPGPQSGNRHPRFSHRGSATGR